MVDHGHLYHGWPWEMMTMTMVGDAMVNYFDLILPHGQAGNGKHMFDMM